MFNNTQCVEYPPMSFPMLNSVEQVFYDAEAPEDLPQVRYGKFLKEI